MNAKIEKNSGSSRTKLEGCVIEKNSPLYSCDACSHKWGDL